MTAHAGATVVALASALVLLASSWTGPRAVSARAVAGRNRSLPSATTRVAADRMSDRELARFGDSLARELRSGAAMADAFCHAARRSSARTARALSAEVGAIERGDRWNAVLAEWSGRSGSVGVSMFATTLAIAHDTGTGAAGAVERCAVAVRDRVELREEVRALTAQVRASALLVTALPLVALAGLGALDPRVIRFFGTGPGVVAGGLGVALETAGWLWMRRLIGADR